MKNRGEVVSHTHIYISVHIIHFPTPNPRATIRPILLLDNQSLLVITLGLLYGYMYQSSRKVMCWWCPSLRLSIN